jgi:hypothetical protein
MMRLSLFVALLVAILVATFTVEKPTAERSSTTSAITCGEKPHAQDGWLQKSVGSVSVAATPVSARLPAFAEDARQRLRIAARRFSRTLVDHPPTHWSVRTAFRRHIPRMDSGEPPSSGRSAS